jgi:hypothetical protein
MHSHLPSVGAASSSSDDDSADRPHDCEHDPCVSKTAANHCNAGGQPIVQGSTCGCGCNAGYSGASCQFTPCTSIEFFIFIGIF